MILVDKDIKRRKDEIFIENYNEESVQPISYDIHIEKIISQDNNDNEISYCLESHEAVMIKCIEKISVPKDLIIRVENKNLKSFQENNFFYYDTKKYHYVIQEVSRYDDKIILKLKLKNKIKLLKDDKTFLLPKTKETIFSLIIESWRSK